MHFCAPKQNNFPAWTSSCEQIFKAFGWINIFRPSRPEHHTCWELRRWPKDSAEIKTQGLCLSIFILSPQTPRYKKKRLKHGYKAKPSTAGCTRYLRNQPQTAWGKCMKLISYEPWWDDHVLSRVRAKQRAASTKSWRRDGWKLDELCCGWCLDGCLRISWLMTCQKTDLQIVKAFWVAKFLASNFSKILQP